ncbi:hypothetical protein GALL_490100 [mine drainage metagenome]|uniref:Uncharacterized protein n=1 Tax=mine drainage metagenome TaxID=410659 RepID=A0A1J5Q0K5_9ZZZZ
MDPSGLPDLARRCFIGRDAGRAAALGPQRPHHRLRDAQMARCGRSRRSRADRPRRAYQPDLRHYRCSRRGSRHARARRCTGHQRDRDCGFDDRRHAGAGAVRLRRVACAERPRRPRRISGRRTCCARGRRCARRTGRAEGPVAFARRPRSHARTMAAGPRCCDDDRHHGEALRNARRQHVGRTRSLSAPPGRHRPVAGKADHRDDLASLYGVSGNVLQRAVHAHCADPGEHRLRDRRHAPLRPARLRHGCRAAPESGNHVAGREDYGAA